MNKNLSIVSKELFGKIRTQFTNVRLGDEESKVTNKPEDARFFDFDYTQDGEVLGTISISISAEDGLVVIYSTELTKDSSEFTKRKFFNFLKELREFAKQHLMSFDTRDISKTNLEKRDYQFLAQNNGESKMSESKLFGTSKTSYQNLGNAKLIVKHSAPVNFENPAGRAQRIESIYVENAEGERFKYPYKHLNGARALAQHVAHGGNPYDNIGKYMIGLSEELNKLRMFKQYVERNDMVSEAMSSVNSKVMERINDIKQEIHYLQSPSKYKNFAESFTESESVEIPEDIVNDWIDRLTVKSFNEELKNVFPYIFKLIDESDVPVKEISAEDLIQDTLEETNKSDLSVPEFEDYESYLDSIISESTDLFGDDNQSSIDQLNQLISQPFPVGVDGRNAIDSLKGIIEDKELMEVFKELADISSETDVRPILQDYVSIKDSENGTTVLSQLNFEGAPTEPPVEEPAAEVPPVEEPAAEVPPVEEPAVDPTAQPAAPVMASIEHKGRKFAEVIQKAVNAGMQLEDTFEVSGKNITLQDAIRKAGLQVEDFFGDKRSSMQKEIIEFVKSMYNREEGSFPKGETGVLIACEKKFGEDAVPTAKKVVEKLTNLGEMIRMKKLAGLK
jgi:hypothetical protein